MRSGSARNRLGRNKRKQLRLAGTTGFAFEKIAQDTNVTEHRNFAFGIRLVELKYPADHKRATVFNQVLCLDMFGNYGDTCSGDCTGAVFVDVKVQNDVAVGRESRRYLKLQSGFAKSD